MMVTVFSLAIVAITIAEAVSVNRKINLNK